MQENMAVLVVGSALSRMAAGIALVAAPRAVLRVWAGKDESVGATMAARALGAREIAIGTAMLLALQDGEPVRRWAQLGMAADGSDALVTLARVARQPRVGSLLVLGMAAGSAVAHAWLAERVR